LYFTTTIGCVKRRQGYQSVVAADNRRKAYMAAAIDLDHCRGVLLDPNEDIADITSRRTIVHKPQMKHDLPGGLGLAITREK
jgi:hypothetical protein